MYFTYTGAMKLSMMVMLSFIILTITLNPTIATPTISMKFESDLHYNPSNPNSYAAISIEITVKDIDINQLILTPISPADDSSQTHYLWTTPWWVPETKLWHFNAYYDVDWKSHGLPHVDDGLPSSQIYSIHCIDTTTKQVIAYAGEDDRNSLYFQPAQSGWNDVHKEPFGQYTMSCPITILNTEKPQSLIISVRTNQSDPLDTFETTLEWPEHVVEPKIDFNKLDVKTTNDPRGSHQITIEFTTDTIGFYKVSLLNGFSLSWSNLNGGYSSPYCSNGKNDTFAKIVFGEGGASIAVENLPSDKNDATIKCDFFTSTVYRFNMFVRSERVSFQIVYSNVSVSRTVDLPLRDGMVYGTMENVSSSDMIKTTVSFNPPPQVTNTPINTNSTIEFKFSPRINVETLNILPQQSEYRGFEDCLSLRGTIFVNSKKNTITLKDIDISNMSVNDWSDLTCVFNFNGAGNFSYDAKQASVSVKIDGGVLRSRYTPTTSAPLYYRATVNMVHSGHLEETSQDGNTIIITDIITISDNYSNIHSTLSHPTVILAIDGPEFFTEDERQEQLKCQVSSPQSSKLVDVEFVYNTRLATWTVELTELIDVETFQIVMKCVRSVPILTKFNLDITPTTSLLFQFVELIDEKRYYGDQEASYLVLSSNPRTQLVSPPANTLYPSNPINYWSATVSLVLPHGPITDEIISNAVDEYGQNLTAALAEANETTLKFNLVNTHFQLSTSFFLVNIHSLVHLDQYHQSRNFESFSGEIETLPIFSIPNQGSDYYTQTTIAKRVFEGHQRHPDDPSFDTYFDERAVVVSATYLFSVQDSSTTSTDATPTVITPYEQILKKYIDKTLWVDTVPEYTTLTAEMKSFTPVTKCGYNDGFYISASSSHKFGIVPGTNDDATQAWEDLVDTYTAGNGHILCGVGDSCEYNADCEQQFYSQPLTCVKNQCTLIAPSIPPYIHHANEMWSTSHNDRYYNNANSIKGLVVLISVIVLSLF